MKIRAAGPSGLTGLSVRRRAGQEDRADSACVIPPFQPGGCTAWGTPSTSVCVKGTLVLGSLPHQVNWGTKNPAHTFSSWCHNRHFPLSVTRKLLWSSVGSSFRLIVWVLFVTFSTLVSSAWGNKYRRTFSVDISKNTTPSSHRRTPKEEIHEY